MKRKSPESHGGAGEVVPGDDDDQVGGAAVAFVQLSSLGLGELRSHSLRAVGLLDGRLAAAAEAQGSAVAGAGHVGRLARDEALESAHRGKATMAAEILCRLAWVTHSSSGTRP